MESIPIIRKHYPIETKGSRIKKGLGRFIRDHLSGGFDPVGVNKAAEELIQAKAKVSRSRNELNRIKTL